MIDSVSACGWLCTAVSTATRGRVTRRAAPRSRRSSSEAVVVGGGQAGRQADGAVDVGDGSARPAQQVVMVVPDPRLVARHGPPRLDASQQTRSGQCSQHVVDSLVGNLTEILTHDTNDRVRVGMRMVVHRGQHRNPRTRHTQSNPS